MTDPMRHITLLVVVLAVTPLTTVRAQDSLRVTVGDRVRVTAPTLDIDKYDGTLQVLAGDTLTIDSLRVAIMSVTRLDVHRGRKSNVGKGVLYGGIPAGLVFGGLVGVRCAFFESDYPSCNFAGGFAVGFAVGFAGGALIGAFIGAVNKSDRWESVPLDQLRVSFVPQRDGRFAFGLSVAF